MDELDVKVLRVADSIRETFATIRGTRAWQSWETLKPSDKALCLALGATAYLTAWRLLAPSQNGNKV